MNSLVLELQRDAIEPSVSLLNLIRKALVVAIKLDIQEFLQWIELELKGYTDQSLIPQYRYISGQVKGRNPYHGWQVVVLDDSLNELLSSQFLKDPISEIEALINEIDQPSIRYTFAPSIQAELMSLTGSKVEFSLFVSKIQFNRIVETIRDVILDWALKLEKAGILGEGMTFSKQEKEVANSINYNIENFLNQTSPNIQNGDIIMSEKPSTNINAGRDAIGNISNSDAKNVAAGSNIRESVHTPSLDVDGINKVLDEIKQTLSSLNLDPKIKGDIDSDIQTVEAQLMNSNPKKQIIKSSFEAIRGILKGTIEKAAATELASHIPSLIEHISSLGNRL